jgi:hypothetical protein
MHALVFVPNMIVLFIINLGWGMGLFCHWFFVLGPGAKKAETSP